MHLAQGRPSELLGHRTESSSNERGVYTTNIEIKVNSPFLALQLLQAIFFCGSGDLVIARATEGKRGTARV